MVAIVGNIVKGIININYKTIIKGFTEIYFKIIAKKKKAISIKSYSVLLALLLKSSTPLY